MSLNFIRVLEAETKRGIATAKVEAKGIVLGPPSTDPQGNVILFSIPLLSYHIKVSKEGYLSAESDITPSGPIHAAELIMTKLPTALPERPREWIPPITPPEIYHPPEVAPAPAPAPTPPQLYYPPTPTPAPTPPPEEVTPPPTPPEVVVPTPTYQLYVSSYPIFVVVTYE